MVSRLHRRIPAGGFDSAVIRRSVSGGSGRSRGRRCGDDFRRAQSSRPVLTSSDVSLILVAPARSFSPRMCELTSVKGRETPEEGSSAGRSRPTPNGSTVPPKRSVQSRWVPFSTVLSTKSDRSCCLVLSCPATYGYTNGYRRGRTGLRETRAIVPVMRGVGAFFPGCGAVVR
jgi:hypothetical protein